MRKIFAMSIVLCLGLSMFGCGQSPADSDDNGTSGSNGSQSSETSAVAEDGDITLGICLCSTTTEYWSSVADGIHAQAGELGVEVTLVAPSSETDVSGQVSMLEDMIASDVDAICCGPCDSTTVGSTLQNAIDAGIPVVIVDTDVTDIERNAFVGISQAEAAYMTKPYVEEALGTGFKAALIGGVQGHEATTGRLEGFTNVCNDLDAEVIETQYGDWTADRAMTITEAFLSKYDVGELDVIMCASDNTALGASSAIKAAGREDVKVVGFDGNPSACQEILDGSILCTVSQDGDAIGQAIVDTLYAYATGGTTDEYVLVDCIGIGPENAADYV